MEIKTSYEFTAEELSLANVYNNIYEKLINDGFGIDAAITSAKSVVLYRAIALCCTAALHAIENDAPQRVARMYEEAYAENEAF